MKKIICLLIALSIIGSSALFADWYIPLNQVPQAVLATARATYPQADRNGTLQCLQSKNE